MDKARQAEGRAILHLRHLPTGSRRAAYWGGIDAAKAHHSANPPASVEHASDWRSGFRAYRRALARLRG